MDFSILLNKLIEGKDLKNDEIEFAFNSITASNHNASQVASFLTALKIKGETVEEIASFAGIMRKNGIKINPKVKTILDTAGTGGDNSKTFNISTCTALVASGAGCVVAKHGNRAVSSKTGSADVLEQLGIKINSDPKTCEKQLETIGISFLFAQVFHPTMKNISGIRKDLGFKTIFNILGPLTNPSNAKRQLIGVYSKDLLHKIAEVLRILGTEKALLVSSDLDELSLSSETQVHEISNNKIKEYAVSPEEFGFRRIKLGELAVENSKQSAEKILEVLKGKVGSARDIVILNSAAAIHAGGIATSIKNGIPLAEKSIDSGNAYEKLNLLRDYDGHS